jgi:hypothetical protein
MRVRFVGASFFIVAVGETRRAISSTAWLPSPNQPGVVRKRGFAKRVPVTEHVVHQLPANDRDKPKVAKPLLKCKIYLA